MIGFAYGAAASLPLASPSSGNNISGSNAVAGIGIDSLIQNTASNKAAPAVRQPSTLKPSGGGSTSVAINKAGPMIQPDHCRSP
jgi:hypothetical protein